MDCNKPINCISAAGFVWAHWVTPWANRAIAPESSPNWANRAESGSLDAGTETGAIEVGTGAGSGIGAIGRGGIGATDPTAPTEATAPGNSPIKVTSNHNRGWVEFFSSDSPVLRYCCPCKIQLSS